MPDSLRRGLRTFADASITTFLTLITLPQFFDTIGGQPVPRWNALESILVACGMSGLIATLTYVKNALEDTGAIPALGKAPASPGANPVPDPGAGRRTVADPDGDGRINL